MLTELSLSQFRAHADTRIALARLSVLVGPNASGKTSVLTALHYLSQLFYKSPFDLFKGERALEWLRRYGTDAPMKIEVSGATGAVSWTFGMTTPSDGDLHEAKCRWSVSGGSGEREVSLADLAALVLSKNPVERPPPEVVALRRAVFLRLDAERLAKPSYSTEEVPRMEHDGYGLATVLSTMKLNSTDVFRALEDAARRIVPSLRGIGFKRTKIQEQRPRVLTVEGQKVVVDEHEAAIADELLLDFVEAPKLPAHAASEGTLIVLGLLAAAYSPAGARLVLLDDIERALHPKAQRDLIAGLRAALDTAPDLQIVATTHSPYLVDALAPEEVVVVARGKDGVVAAKRLCEHPGLRHLDVLTTGEFLTAEGEDWVAEP